MLLIWTESNGGKTLTFLGGKHHVFFIKAWKFLHQCDLYQAILFFAFFHIQVSIYLLRISLVPGMGRVLGLWWGESQCEAQTLGDCSLIGGDIIIR